jgi:hypothetical protein
VDHDVAGRLRGRKRRGRRGTTGASLSVAELSLRPQSQQSGHTRHVANQYSPVSARGRTVLTANTAAPHSCKNNAAGVVPIQCPVKAKQPATSQPNCRNVRAGSWVFRDAMPVPPPEMVAPAARARPGPSA